MWVDQGTLNPNQILINKLSQCLGILDEYAEKEPNETHASFIHDFKVRVNHLLNDLYNEERYDTDEFKLLKRLSKQGVDLFSGKFKHRSFVKICKKLYRTLTEIGDPSAKSRNDSDQKAAVPKREIKWHTVNRVCFRGDIHPPKAIFKKSFYSQGKGSIKNPVVVNSRFLPAVLFPLDESVDTIWVYIFYVVKGLDHEAGTTVHLNELITDQVEPDNIIGAVKLVRYGEDSTKQGRFLIKEYIKNPKCRLSPETKELAEWYVHKEKEAHKIVPNAREIPQPHQNEKSEESNLITKNHRTGLH